MSDGRCLPGEIVADVLSRLPVKTLCLCKCVSPSWKALISEPHFIKTHLTRSQSNNPKQIILISSSNALFLVDFTAVIPTATKLDFPPSADQPGKRIAVFSCNGLLLVSTKLYDDNSNFLLNPSTRECRKLPRLPFARNSLRGHYLFLFGFGYDSSTDDYKVVMLSKYYRKCDSASESVCESVSEVTIVVVYTLKTNTWRRIQDFNYVPVEAVPGVYLHGCLHSICWRKGFDWSCGIGAFDLADQIFREVPLPASLDKAEIIFWQLDVLGGCLCLVDQPSDNRADVWMMKEYGVSESWTKFTINLPEMSVVTLLCLLGEDEFLVKTNGIIRSGINIFNRDKLVVHNPKNETLRDMAVCGIPTKFTCGGTYVESLISPSHGGGIG